ncbi:MAG: branched-chain amino acid ABC transporter permease [Rhodocyclaceae bacterium]|nr:branched-chain amino acid ABC transporter permease [Rhodocyclaceae bacterium]
MDQFLSLAIAGIATGCVYALVALGFVLIWKATEVVNFAQGELMMLGGFVGLGLVTLGWPWPLALAGAALLCALFGLLAERAVLRPLLGQPHIPIVMTTLGLGFMLKGAVTMAPGWGTETHALPTPFAGQVASLAGTPVAADQLLVIAVTVLLGLVLFGFFRATRLGKALRATAQNPLGAQLVGIPLARMHGIVWALAAGLAAVAGVLLAPVTFVHAHMGLIGLKALPAAVIGGFGSVPGAVAGGLLLGLVESFAGFYAPDGIKDVAAHVLVLAVLLLRPAGLFGHPQENT